MRIVLLVSLVLISCCKPEPDPKNESKVDPFALELNERAVDRFQKFNLGLISDKDSLELSINELDSALSIEPKNAVFYSNKSEILLTLNRDDEALALMKHAVQVIPHYAEGFSLIGFIYEYRGNSKESQVWFDKAIYSYDKRIQEDRFIVNSKVNKAFLYFFTEGEKKAIQEYEKLKKEYPNDESVLYMEFIFEDFDKESFLKEILIKDQD